MAALQSLYHRQSHKRSPQLTLGNVIDDVIKGEAGFMPLVNDCSFLGISPNLVRLQWIAQFVKGNEVYLNTDIYLG